MGYRMIIADDEEMLIQLIKKLGRFEELGIEIVDECHDGEEAYRSILKHCPDFVLTDIQMPVLDGLEMISQVQRSVPDTLFVLISGYRYFEYARSAIQLSVVDYLLKPVNEEQLNQLLTRLCRLTDERRRQKMDSETLQNFRDTETKEKYDGFWKLILRDDDHQIPAALLADEVKNHYDITFAHPCFRMLILDYHMPQVSETGRFSFVDKLNEAANAAFGGKLDYYIYEEDSHYAVLLNFEEEQIAVLRTATSVFFYSCKDMHEIFGNFRLTLGLSNVCHAMTGIPNAAAEAQAASWGWLYFSGDQIIRFEQVRKMQRVDVNALLPKGIRQNLQESLRYLKSSELASVFSGMKQALNETDYIYPGDIRRLYLAVREQVQLGAAESLQESLLQKCDAALKSAWEPVQAFRNVYMELKQYVEEQQALLEKAGRNPIRRAQEYIHQNYAGAISLESTAEEVGISSAYLSKIFKEINGVGFSEYLNNVRLEASKKLLSGTSLSIRDVAAEVGYIDEKYYSKLFKKQFGIKPTEYRRLYG